MTHGTLRTVSPRLLLTLLIGLLLPAAALSRATVTNAAGSKVAVGKSAGLSIWGDFTPENTTHVDGAAVELGVSFQTRTPIVVTGLRFFKAGGEGGPYTGHLWTESGIQLAEVTFTNVGERGWQQASLTTPVALTPNLTYIASYHTPSGSYAATNGYFPPAGFDSGPIQTASGSNGRFRYGPSGSFPDDSFRSTNYWVDIVYATTATPQPGFTISVSASGDETAVNVLLTDSLPAGLEWTTRHPRCTIAANVLSCALGDLPAGSVTIIHVTAPAGPTTCGAFASTATVTAAIDREQPDNSAAATFTLSCPPSG